MATFRVNDKCNGCLGCVQNCPGRALDFRDVGDTRTLLHNPARCARCATCYRVCPQKAVEFGALLEDRWDEFASMAVVSCTVCGEVVGTERLPAAPDSKTRELALPLCPRHKARAAGLARLAGTNVGVGAGQPPGPGVGRSSLAAGDGRAQADSFRRSEQGVRGRSSRSDPPEGGRAA